MLPTAAFVRFIAVASFVPLVSSSLSVILKTEKDLNLRVMFHKIFLEMSGASEDLS